MGDPVIIIGAGIGGLSAAIHLSAAGKQVCILEQNQQVGGKMSEFHHAGYRWDTGPSLITMKPVFEDLFKTAGAHLYDYLDFQPIEPFTLFYFPDGKRLIATRDLPRMLDQINTLEPKDVAGYLRFLAYAARLYKITAPLFIFDEPPRLSSMLRISPLEALRFDGLRTMSQAIEGYVRSPEIRQMLGMFATYVGASPYLAPATLNVIAHVELNQGVWYPTGGIYQIARSFSHLAEKLGVEIKTGKKVVSIQTLNETVRGVQCEDGSYQPASAVIANIDVALVEMELLPKSLRRPAPIGFNTQKDRSCSAFVMLLGLRAEHQELAHHNTFFSADYRKEFEQIFMEHRPPGDPTIYVSITSKNSPEDAPSGAENWFVQVNVPALSPGWNWEEQAESYASLVLQKLAERGLDVRDEIEYSRLITPTELASRTGAWQGALYGATSNSRWAAFRRPHNRSTRVRGLYFAGGTTHPGGGVPMVVLSGKVASSLLLEDQKGHRR